MTAVPLFPFAEYRWFYASFTVFVLGMLALDLGVFHRLPFITKINRREERSKRESLDPVGW